MELSIKKLELIEWLLNVQDMRILNMVEAISEGDWYDSLGEEEKASIQRGLDQANRGELKKHSEVMEKYKKWL